MALGIRPIGGGDNRLKSLIFFRRDRNIQRSRMMIQAQAQIRSDASKRNSRAETAAVCALLKDLPIDL